RLSRLMSCRSLSLRDRIVFDGNLIVRREVAKEIADTRLGFMSVDFPSFDVPVKYVRPQALAVSLPEWELVDTLLNLISKDSVEAYVRRLEEFATRYTYADSVVAARDWLIEKFNQFGYDAVIDSFEMGGLPYGDYAFNVVADHTGTTASEVLIILCGHFDSIARGTPEFVAPGADDNATGTAFCLEIARVLQGFETPKTVRFICFSGEEQGLVGSEAYVGNHPGLNIEVVINADMIGYTRDDFSDVKLFLMSDTEPHADFIADNMIRYTTLAPNFPGNSGNSDHAPFQQAGYRAMFVHEDIFSPFYHSVNDLADNLDFSYMTEIVKGCAAATYNMALMPQVVEGLTVSDPGIGDRLLAEWDEAVDSREFQYEIMIGTTSGDYVRSHFVSKGENTFVLDGLEDGRLYYIAARTVMNDTLESIAVREVTGIPVSLPYPATDIAAMPAFRSIE
ncbi:MAG: Zn-dependent exopeptidase M28, partial [candidate division Zixibacteria bacterium]|nr:Zn-dependent exopeptidase M28 [candidate division Zixibacteria bacterium]